MISKGRVEHEATYPHPPERVWRALVDPGELAVWLMPTDFAPEVGRAFVLERGRWSGGFGDTEVSFELFPERDGTRLRVCHDGFGDPPVAEGDAFDNGWRQKLDEDLPRLMEAAR